MLLPVCPVLAFLLVLDAIFLVSALTTEWKFESRTPPANDDADGTMAGQNGRKTFRGFKLLRLNPRSGPQLDWLRLLYASDTNSPPPYFELDFWQPPSQLGALIDVTVAPGDASAFFAELRRRQVDYLVMADDLEELILREKAAANKKENGGGGGEFRDDEFSTSSAKSREKEAEYRYDRYNPLSRIEEQLFRLRELYPKLVSLFEIGKSHENRSIVTAKVSARQPSPEERWHPFRGTAVWIDGGIHAREWIAPAAAMLLLSKLVNGYNSADVNIRYLVESIDWYITPVLNPDGYEYSHTKNRMWRKNRRPAFCKQQYFNRICCSGVDLNRNFDWFWSITGSSSDPCHETYHGPSAFSEPESRAVRDFLEEHPVKSFITLHSYSQLWLIPYGHKRRNYPEDYHTVQRPLSLRAVKALQRLYGTEYQVGSGADLLYEASGSSHDFAKGALNVPFSFLVELRPQNTLHSTGFLLPEAEIADTADETWEAIKVVADKTLERFAPLVDGRRNWKGTPAPPNAGTTAESNTKGSSTLGPPEPSTRRTTAAKGTTTSQEREKAKKVAGKTTKQPQSSTERERPQQSSSRHTFLPNTIATTVAGILSLGSSSIASKTAKTTKSLPAGTTLAPPPLSVSVRNNAKTGSGTKAGAGGNEKPSGGGSGGPDSGERPSGGGEARKTIVNVKICTGGKGFPGLGESSQEEDKESGEQGTGSQEEVMPKPPQSATRRLVKCRDWSSYCKWWRMHSLCSDARVRKLCSLSCMIECQI